MASKLAPEAITTDVSEFKYINFQFSADLDAKTIVSVTDVVVESGTLTVDNITDDGGTLVSCRISAGTVGVVTLRCTIVDNSSPTQTFIGRGKVTVA